MSWIEYVAAGILLISVVLSALENIWSWPTAIAGVALPFADSALTSFSLLAQFMMARKYLENWHLWITVDVFYIAMFIFKHLYPTAVLYAAFIGACTLGLVQWRKAITPVAQRV